MDPAAARFGKGPGKWNSGNPPSTSWSQGAGKGGSKGGGASCGGWGQGATSGGGSIGQAAVDTGWGQSRDWSDKSGSSNSWSSSNGWSSGSTSQSDNSSSWSSQWHSSGHGSSGHGSSGHGSDNSSWNWKESSQGGGANSGWHSSGGQQQASSYGRNEQPSKWPPQATASSFPEWGSAHSAQAGGRNEQPTKWTPPVATSSFPEQSSVRSAQVPKEVMSRGSSAPAIGSAAPISLTVSGCQHKTIDRILNGTFVVTGEKHHNLPVYKKNEQISGLNVMLYYWDERDGPAQAGWWFSPEVGDDQVWGYHPERGSGGVPPPVGWMVPCTGPVDPLFRVTPTGGKSAPTPQILGYPPGSRSSSLDARRDDERKRADERKRMEEQQKQEEQRRLEKQKEMHRRKQEELAELQRRKQEELRQAQEAKRKADEEWYRQREEHERRQWEEMRRAEEAKRRAEDEARRQRAEYERRQWEEQQKKLEEQRAMEDMRRKAAEEQQRKVEEARKEAERQRAEEARLKKESAEKKMAEQKAAGAVRRVIQKTRVATAANMEALTKELNDTLAEETANLGGQFQQLEEECEKALNLAQKRIDQAEEQRQKAEQKKQEIEKQRKEREDRLKALIEELEGFVETARTGTGKVKETMERLTGMGQDETREAMTATMDEVEAACVDAKKASKVCSEFVVSNKAELKEPDPEARAKLKNLLDHVQECNAVNESTITKVKEARAGLEKRFLAVEKKKESQLVFERYDKDADGKLSREEILSYAKGEFKCEVPAASLDSIMEHHAETSGVPLANFFWVKMAVGVEREVQRDRHRHREKLEMQERVSTAKAQLQDKIKDVTKAVDEAESQVVASEQNLQKLKAKSKCEDMKGLLGLAVETDSMAEAAKTSVAGAKALIASLSQSLSDGYRKELQVWLSSESKRFDIRLGRMDARIGRVETLIKQVRDEAAKRQAMEIDSLRMSAVKVIRHNQMIRKKGTSEAMFDELDAKGDGVLDEEEFLAFFASADKVLSGGKEVEAAATPNEPDKSTNQETQDSKQEAQDAATEAQDANMSEEPNQESQEAQEANQEAQDDKMEAQDANQEAQEGEEGKPAEEEAKPAEEEAKPAEEEAKPAEEEANPAEEEAKPAEEEAKPAEEEAKPAEDAKPAKHAKPAKVAKPEEIVVIPPEEAKKVFAHLCEDGADTISKEAFVHFMRFYLRVVRQEALASDMSPDSSEVVRKLAPKEVIEVLQGPLKEEVSGSLRAEVRVFKDGAQGWVSFAGSQGSDSLREGGHVFKVVKETVLTRSLSIDPPKDAPKSKQVIRKLKAGEILELLEWPVKEGESGLMRAKVKALSDGGVGFATAVGNMGTVLIDLV